MSLKVDSHQHYWQLSQPFDYGWLKAPELAKINRDFMPADLKSRIDAVGVDRTVFVQTQHDVAENRWALQLARENDFIAGIVGWVDLASPACEEQLMEFKPDAKFVGVRHITQDEPDDDFIIRPDVIRGLETLQKHGVPFDLLFYVQHLNHAETLGRRLPELPMVIDHLAKPQIKIGAIDSWRDDLRKAAQCPNIFCKLSGMITEADWDQWKPADLKPYVETAVEAFGPQRCMFGSDWPVSELAGTYDQVHAALTETVGTLSESEHNRIFGGTACEFYGLPG